MALILPGNVASATADAGYNVANSCRFDGGSSYLTAGSFGTPTSATTCTLSFWVKRCEVDGGSANYICGTYDGSRSNALDFVYDAANTLSFYHGSSDGNGKLVKPARLFRDPSAWTHVVWACDTTQGTAANRIKVYFDGVEDAKATATYPDEDAESKIFADTNNKIGSNWNATTGTILDGYLAEFVFIDGLALAASSFGEFDEDSPTIWKPKDVSDLTFGDNGFWLDFEDSSAFGNDVSGNNNDFTTSGLAATDQATDTPTNNFATLNPLFNSGSVTLTEGNCKITAIGDNDNMISTIFTSMKVYFEIKVNAAHDGSGGGFTVGGLHEDAMTASGITAGTHANFPSAGVKVYTNSNDGRFTEGTGNTISGQDGLTRATTNDIVGVALDGANGKIYVHVNGTYVNSGDTDGESGFIGGTTASTGLWTPYFSSHLAKGLVEVNFGGSPAFTVSSGNADGNGYGNFEYAVPSGYYALNTKNLAEYG